MPSSRFSSTVMGPNNCLPSGICTSLRDTIPSTPTESMRRPWKVILPLAIRTTPEIALSKVLLPAPLAPTMVTISPSPTVRSIPWRTSIRP